MKPRRLHKETIFSITLASDIAQVLRIFSAPTSYCVVDGDEVAAAAATTVALAGVKPGSPAMLVVMLGAVIETVCPVEASTPVSVMSWRSGGCDPICEVEGVK